MIKTISDTWLFCCHTGPGLTPGGGLGWGPHQGSKKGVSYSHLFFISLFSVSLMVMGVDTSTRSYTE